MITIDTNLRPAVGMKFKAAFMGASVVYTIVEQSPTGYFSRIKGDYDACPVTVIPTHELRDWSAWKRVG